MLGRRSASALYSAAPRRGAFVAVSSSRILRAPNSTRLAARWLSEKPAGQVVAPSLVRRTFDARAPAYCNMCGKSWTRIFLRRRRTRLLIFGILTPIVGYIAADEYGLLPNSGGEEGPTWRQRLNGLVGYVMNRGGNNNSVRIQATATGPVNAGRPYVSVVRLDGSIMNDPQNSFNTSGVLNSRKLEPLLMAAFMLEDTKAVCLEINCPGGQVVQSFMIYDQIRRIAEKRNIPVYAFVEDIGASGGYLMAIAADQIYADQNSLVGSIGVIFGGGFGFDKVIEKLGVDRRVYTSGMNKARLDMFKEENPEDVKWVKKLAQETHDTFIDKVMERRSHALNIGARFKKEDVFSGDVFRGETAKEIGLIDGVGDLRTICKRDFGDDVVFVTFEKKESLFSSGLLTIESAVGALTRAGSILGGVSHDANVSSAINQASPMPIMLSVSPDNVRLRS